MYGLKNHFITKHVNSILKNDPNLLELGAALGAAPLFKSFFKIHVLSKRSDYRLKPCTSISQNKLPGT